MVKRVFKYPTGAVIPKGAVYLDTIVEQIVEQDLIWHYFLVEVEDGV